MWILMGLFAAYLVGAYAIMPIWWDRYVYRHPVVGTLDLTYETLDLPADGQILCVYGAQPGSDADEALRLLASWATEAQRRPVKRS